MQKEIVFNAILNSASNSYFNKILVWLLVTIHLSKSMITLVELYVMMATILQDQMETAQTAQVVWYLDARLVSLKVNVLNVSLSMILCLIQLARLNVQMNHCKSIFQFTI